MRNYVSDISDWNEKDTRCHSKPASLGMGVNLQDGGSTLIGSDSPEPTSADERKASPPGTKKAQSLFIIICEGTIDEDVMKALKKKKNALIPMPSRQPENDE